jgi:hypothetical protein
MERTNIMPLVPDQPRESGETEPHKLTETEARAQLTAFTKDGKAPPSHRDLAAQWGWHRSRVARFLAWVDRETKAETRPETPARERLIASAGPGITDWTEEAAEDGTVLVHEQPFTAVYFNNQGQVVIRQKGDDPAIFIAPESIDRLIERLIKCRNENRWAP